jgi:hypothetical protein
LGSGLKNSDKRVYARQYMKMTVAEIADRVAELRVLEARDREAAAAGAAELRVEVLAAIAGGAREARELAAAAMVTVVEDIGGD